MTTLEILKNKYPLVVEEDFDDALYQGAYGGTNYYFDTGDAIKLYCYNTNQLTYMGESYTYSYNKKELLDDIRNRNYSSVIRQFPSGSRVVNKIFESLGINCDEYYANDETYLEINE